jgi:hypothetical protein
MVRKMIKIVVRMFWTASICSPFTSRMTINFLWLLLLARSHEKTMCWRHLLKAISF